jgi:hypothetical protein
LGVIAHRAKYYKIETESSYNFRFFFIDEKKDTAIKIIPKTLKAKLSEGTGKY